MRFFLVLFVALLGAIRAQAEVDPALLAAARQEREVVWYTGLAIDGVVRPMATAFAAKYPGIDVRYSRASDTDTAVKLLNEARARRVQAGLFDGTSAMFPLLDAGLIAGYAPQAAAHYPPDLRDPDGYWTAFNVFYLAVACNTDLVAAGDAPRNYDDLLAPQWRGQIAFPAELAPQGPPGFVFNILNTMGEAEGMDYLRRLASQQPVLIRASRRAVLDQVVSGEYRLAVMVYNHHVAASAAMGAPVRWLQVEPLLAVPTLISILKDAPHPNAARLLAEFILSRDGQQVLADTDHLPADPTVPARIPELKPDAGHFKVNLLAPKMVQANLPRWRTIFREVFR